MAGKKTIRICPDGHQYEKSSDYQVCSICEATKNPADGFYTGLGAPVRRALENAGINTVSHLSRKTKKEILQLHGMGPSSIPKLQEKLRAAGLDFA
jgi:DNA-directed RNA polymerase alpha subunit